MDILNAVVTAVVGFGSAGISLKIGQSNFFRERMWEQRVATYSKVLEALAKMKQYCAESDNYVNRVRYGKRLTDDDDKELYDRTAGRYEAAYDEAKSTLTILALSESFVLSSEANQHLNKLLHDMEESVVMHNRGECDGPYEQRQAIDQCIKAFKETADKDLFRNNGKRK